MTKRNRPHELHQECIQKAITEFIWLEFKAKYIKIEINSLNVDSV